MVPERRLELRIHALQMRFTKSDFHVTTKMFFILNQYFMSSSWGLEIADLHP